MDYFFQASDAAEDQERAKTMLVVHVAHRGYNLGTFIGLGSAIVVSGVRAIRGKSASLPPVGASPAISPFVARVLRFSARGSMLGLAFGLFAVTGRMWGRELIEWQDRSWRLLNHAGQKQTDNYSMVGLAVGGAVGALVGRRVRYTQQMSAGLSTSFRPLLRPRTMVLGGAATGSALAIVAMIGLRTVVQTGKESKLTK